MEFIDLVHERRSIRGYDKDKKVTKEQLENVIKVAQMAPTWKNTQNARYYCVCGEGLEEFREKALPVFNQKSSVGAALVVCTYVKGLAGYGPNGPADDIEETGTTFEENSHLKASVIMDMIAAMAEKDSELISVYYGSDVKEEDAQALQAKIQEAYPTCDIELQYGGQPIYYYIVSVE